MKTLTKLFLLCAFCAIIAMFKLDEDAFIVSAGLANVFGLWAIAKSLHSDEWRV